jgi:hypothetical protein
MLASAYDLSRGFRGESVAVMGFPDSDPTDGEAESAPKIAEPERRLFFAVLTDAIVRVRQLATGRRKHARYELLEAVRWFRSNDVTWPCSFINVCLALDIAHEPLRRTVLMWLHGTSAEDEGRVTRRGLLVTKKRRPRVAGSVSVRAAADRPARQAARRVASIDRVI